ncbi:DUF6151 family protein [Palleronia rufa]|uniref:DUF6151 family protein n=1 Tax=Palleronia rufa TaxID=1530186 RepID=UPI00055C1237|nr:DUF6151 family protein [Palleronia rufa]
MSEPVHLSCGCGRTAWQIAPDAQGSRVVCYCADCQTFARHLSAPVPVLDGDGGSHIFQTLPSQVRILKGADNLAVLRLGPKGIFRWYAACCNTPVANTLPKSTIPFVGMILRPGTTDFGKVVARAFTDAARRPIKQKGMARAGLGVISRAIAGRLAGAHRAGPFFSDSGAPVVEPRTLTEQERAAARPR